MSCDVVGITNVRTAADAVPLVHCFMALPALRAASADWAEETCAQGINWDIWQRDRGLRP